MNHFQDRHRKRASSVKSAVVQTRLFVSHSMPIFAAGMKTLLGSQHQAIELLERQDLLHFATQEEFSNCVLLLDWPGLQTIKAAFDSRPGSSTAYAACLSQTILILSQHEYSQVHTEQIPSQITRIISPTQGIEGFFEAIAATIKGHSFIDPILAIVGKQRSAINPRLTLRQIEVLKLIGDGLTNKEIGIKLGISKRTAEKHRANMKSVLKVNTTVELVLLGKQLNLID